MSHTDVFSIRPGEVGDATSQLSELGDRIRRVLDAEALSLRVDASARDEVSQRVASTLNEVHTSFTKAADQGHAQIREVASTLRTHNSNVVAADQGEAV